MQLDSYLEKYNKRVGKKGEEYDYWTKDEKKDRFIYDHVLSPYDLWHNRLSKRKSG